MKRRPSIGLWVVCGVSAAGLAGLLAVAIPKMDELAALEAEWARIEPLAQRGAELSKQETRKDSSSESYERDPRLLLPSRDEALEFGKMVSQCAETAKIDLPEYHINNSLGLWPAKTLGGLTLAKMPRSYQGAEGEEAEDPSGKILRHQFHAKFRSDFDALLKFCDELQKIPRFAQICALQIEGKGAAIQAEIWIEAYSLQVP